MADGERSVWIPPSDWVAFSDVEQWIESRFLEPPPIEWIRDIFDAVQQHGLPIPNPVRHRVQDLNESNVSFVAGNTRNPIADPPGLKLASPDRARNGVRDVVVAEWDKAGFDSRTFTVAGRLSGGGRSRHPIEAYWIDVQQRIQAHINRRSFDKAKVAAGTPAPANASPLSGLSPEAQELIQRQSEAQRAWETNPANKGEREFGWDVVVRRADFEERIRSLKIGPIADMAKYDERLDILTGELAALKEDESEVRSARATERRAVIERVRRRWKERDQRRRTPHANGDPGPLIKFLQHVGIHGDWYHLAPPEEEEALGTYVTRAILGHQAVIAIAKQFQRFVRPTITLVYVQPTEMTLSNWQSGFTKDDAFDWHIFKGLLVAFGHPESNVVEHYLDRVVKRLWVEFFAQVSARNLMMLGRFAHDPEYQQQPINPDLLLNPAMWLDPGRGRFWPMRPEEAGNGPDISGLTLRTAPAAHEASAAVPAPPLDPRPKPSDRAVRQWFRDRVTKWPDDKPAPSEEVDWNAANEYFAPGLSRQEFRTVRIAETLPEWRKQGPRLAWGKAKSAANPPIRHTQI